MNTFATIIFVIGILIYLLGMVLMLRAAYEEGCLWVIGIWILPIVDLIFLITHWKTAKYGFLTRVLGIAVMVVAAMLWTPSGTSSDRKNTRPSPTPTATLRYLDPDDVLGPR